MNLTPDNLQTEKFKSHNVKYLTYENKPFRFKKTYLNSKNEEIHYYICATKSCSAMLSYYPSTEEIKPSKKTFFHSCDNKHLTKQEFISKPSSFEDFKPSLSLYNYFFNRFLFRNA